MPFFIDTYTLFPAAGGSYDVDAQAYFTKCEGEGYTFPGGWKTAFDAFYVGLKADSLYTSIIEMGHFAHGDVAANKVKMKNPNNAFVGFSNSPTHGANGVAFNGTNQYATPGLAPSASGSSASFGMGAYVQTMSGTSSATFMGSENGSSDTLLRRANGTQATWSVNRVTYTTTTNTNTQFLFISRTASNAQALYRNGSSVVSNSGTANGNNSSNIAIGAILSFGSPASYINATISFWIMTTGLNATQVGNLNTRINTLLTATAGI